MDISNAGLRQGRNSAAAAKAEKINPNSNQSE